MTNFIGDYSNKYQKDNVVMQGAITYPNRETLLKSTSSVKVGTFSYLIDEEAVLVRVNNGWKYLMVKVSSNYISNH